MATVNDKDEVEVEGEVVGRLEGFRFHHDPEAAVGGKALEDVGAQSLQAEFAKRADKFYNSPDTDIGATEQGGLIWGTDAVGRLEAGADMLAPRVRAFADEMLEPALVEKIERRLSHWIDRRVAALFEPLIALRDDPMITGLASRVAVRLVEKLGVLPRREAAEDVKALSQDGRAMLRKHGVRFGQHTIFMPALLKPAPTRLRLILWGLASDLAEIPPAPPPGHVTILAVSDAPAGYYPMAGYRPCGPRALRIDMLERLADMIRPLDARGGFEATADMLSITGATAEQFAEVLESLGFKAERGERPKVRRPAVAEKKPDTSTPPPAEASAGTPTESAQDPSAETPAETLAESPEKIMTKVPTSLVESPAGSPTGTPAKIIAAAPADAPAGESPQPAAEEILAVMPAETPDETRLASGADKVEANPAEAAAPVEMETFYTFRIAPRPKRRRAPGPENADAGEARQARGPYRGKGDGGKGAREKSAGKGGRAAPKSREFPAAPPRRPAKIDPDSPFAVLQKLKSDR